MARVVETALNFGEQNGLVGVLTRSLDAPPTDVALVILNAGVLHRVGPNRVHVRLARAVAQAGTPCLRFDLPGIGDSRNVEGAATLLEEAVIGIGQAFDVLERHDVAKRFLVFGLCSGADHAFVIACTDPRVVGIAMVDPTVIFPTSKAKALRFLKWMVRPGGWLRLLGGRYNVTSRLMGLARDAEAESVGSAKVGMTVSEHRARIEQELQGMLERDVQLCYLITGARTQQYQYRRQLFDTFPRLPLERSTRVEIFPESEHTFHRESERETLREAVLSWVGSVVPKTESAGAAAD